MLRTFRAYRCSVVHAKLQENVRGQAVSASQFVQETRIATDIIKTFEPLLRDYEKDQGLRVNHAEEEPGSKVGDNYMSIIVRTKITGVHGNGAPYRATFITKRFPRHRQIISFIRNADLFYNEAHAYTKILPHLGSIGPKCLYADSNDIIMEDLHDQGYVVCERRNLLDLQHCEAAIKALALLHARSLILKLNSPEVFETITDPLLEAAFPQDDGSSIGKSVDMSFTLAIQHLTSVEKLDDEVERAVNFMKSYENRGYDVMRDLVFRRKEKYHVLTHGDAWNNNIIFKHDENGQVTDVKLIDFQIMRHSSPAIDFHYFVYTSARSSVINDSYDNLVKTYHTALVKEMHSLGADENTLRDLSVEWFKSELKKMSMYGLFTGVWLLNAVLAEDDETLDMDTLTLDFFETRENREPPVRAVKYERMKFIVLHYCRTYVWSN